MSDPVGGLCVLPDQSHQHWLVSICLGNGRKFILRRFEARDKAAEWAIEERARHAGKDQRSLVIHFPDDCPCCGNCSTW